MKELFNVVAFLIVLNSVQFLYAGQCDQKQEVGLCDALIPRYYYDVTKKVCTKFYYGGCGGNSNNFETLADCQSACGQCYQKPEAGFCKALLLRFYYDPARKACAQFYYGGCGGNANNFHTMADCQATCGDAPDKSAGVTIIN